MELPDSADRLGALLRGPWSVPLRPGSSLVDVLVAAYERAGDEPRSRFGESLAELLSDRANSLIDETGEALQSALELVKRARIRAAEEPLRSLVSQRTLTLPVGDYSDLHGRAIEALAAIHGLDLLASWREELKQSSGDYAPLVFALVRDYDPDHLKDLMPDVARLGFLREALRTVVLRYPERGYDLVLECARFVGGLKDTALREQFRDALPKLGLRDYETDAVRKELGLAPTQKSSDRITVEARSLAKPDQAEAALAFVEHR